MNPFDRFDEANPFDQFDKPRERTLLQTIGQGAKDVAAGAVRGAGSIGATILRPFESGEENAQRRQAMDDALRELVGADTDSWAYKGGKLGGEIAGTAGAGGLLARPVAALASTRFASGLEPLIEGAARAVQTGGFRVGELAGTGAGTAARLAGGVGLGAAAAGLVDPQTAGMGALIGGVLPAATQVAGMAGRALRGNPGNIQPQLLDSARAAIGAGYTIPPATVNPSFVNRTLESVSGKMATQQLASVRNDAVTRRLVNQSLGLADDAPISLKVLEGIREEAAAPYRAIAGLPKVPAQPGSSVLNRAPAEAIDPAKMVHDLRVARNESQSWFKAYNRSAHPDDLAKAKGAAAQATELEDALEKYAGSLGRDDLLPALREARTRIAKTYDVERALNNSTGGVDARVFGKLYDKGRPLSGGLEEVGRFASAFPTVAKMPERIGTPDAHNIRALASALTGVGGAAAAGPLGAAAAAIPFVAPPVARSIMFRQGAQRGLLDMAPLLTEQPMGALSFGASRALPLLPAE